MPFHLDKPKATEPTFIFFKTEMPDGPFKYSTRQKILPDYWSQKSQAAIVQRIPKNSIEDNKTINAILTRFGNTVADYLRMIKRDDLPFNRAHLTAKLDVVTRRKEVFKKKSFLEYCEIIIKDMKEGRLLTDKGKRYSKGTIKNYGQTLDKLNDFSALRPFSFGSITLTTYREFIEFCNLKSYSLNYVGQHLKNWKCLIREGYKREWHTNKIYDFEDFKTLSEETYDIYLPENELELIYKKSLSFNKTMELARDWFIIDCRLGLRVCDLQILDSRHVLEDMVKIVNEKTDELVAVPVHWMIKEITAKYKGLPPRISEQEINISIKKVGELVGLNQQVIYSVTEGGVRKDYYLKKWEMMSNHTARRTFITNLLKAGIPHTQVMKLAGIKKLSTLQKYDKMTVEETAQLLSTHAYFQKAV